jgi:hypothetical protein
MYYRTINYQFIIDDHDHIKPVAEKTKNPFLFVWEHFYGIKITNLKLTHFFSILIHAIVCSLIYVLFGQTKIAFITAVLFALNPVNNQCSIWLSGRAYAISTMLFLVGMISGIFLPVFYGLANWWSINSLFAPLLFLYIKPHWFGLLIPLGLLLIKGKTKQCYSAGKERFNGATNIMTEVSFRKLIITFKTLGYYVALAIFPFKLGMCHRYMSTFGLTKEETDECWDIDWYFFLGIITASASVYALFHHDPFLFGIFWFTIFTLQWLNFIVISHLITERYIYLANIGLMYSLAQLIVNTPFQWIFLTFYAVRLWYFIPAYKDIISYWRSNTDNFPKVAMGWNQLGLGQLNFGNAGSALDSWIRGVQERPCDFRLNFNTANILVGTGNVKDAVRFVKTAEANLDPKNGYDFWKEKLEAMKTEIRKRGVEI